MKVSQGDQDLIYPPYLLQPSPRNFLLVPTLSYFVPTIVSNFLLLSPTLSPTFSTFSLRRRRLEKVGRVEKVEQVGEEVGENMIKLTKVLGTSRNTIGDHMNKYEK